MVTGTVLGGKVLITGGSGSLGKAILDRAEREHWQAQLTVYSRDEVKQGVLRRRFPDVRFVLGDVRDPDALWDAMRGQQLVIHAGAYKQVPAAEVNVMEAVETNVIGSRNIIRAARRAGVERVIGISTDKACAPVNCYGQSKALMEKMFAQAAMTDGTRFNCVRYGNVLGSTGSIVPLFQQQRESGCITVTDPDMTRFWLTLDDGIDLILIASQLLEPGTVLVPKAPASTMAILAEAVAPECKVEIIGTRPGEKKHEQLLHPGEAPHTDPWLEHFLIWPAYSAPRDNLPDGYEYRSDTARQLSVQELRVMLGETL